jgi:hypothetical protein
LKNVHGNFHSKNYSNVYRFSCNFGLKDRTHVLPKDMQKLILSMQQKRKRRKVNDASMRRKGNKLLIEIPKSTQLSRQSIRIGKMMSRMSIKHGCQRSFVAKQMYLNHNLCQLIYLHAKHTNKKRVVCHGIVVIGYQHALGSQLSDAMKAHLMQLLRQWLSHAQIMTHHKSYVKEQAQRNEPITCDTFVLPSNVRNLAKKRVDELWQKHPKDPISARMWVFETRN